jgi:hypothetical protein
VKARRFGAALNQKPRTEGIPLPQPVSTNRLGWLNVDPRQGQDTLQDCGEADQHHE